MSARRKSDAVKKPKVSEAAVEYETKSSMAEVFWVAFKALSPEDQGAFLRKMLDDPEWYEEIADAVAIIEGENDSYRPFEEFEEELRREKLL
jgi:hypothetical protein